MKAAFGHLRFEERDEKGGEELRLAHTLRLRKTIVRYSFFAGNAYRNSPQFVALLVVYLTSVDGSVTRTAIVGGPYCACDPNAQAEPSNGKCYTSVLRTSEQDLKSHPLRSQILQLALS